jgi:hypothetical protein
METNTRSTLVDDVAPPPLHGPRVGRRCHAPDLAVLTELQARGARCVGVINAATAALVSVIADALATEAWQGFGIRSPEHWVTLRFGLSAAHAARLVAAARVLPDLPACRDAFAAGEITEDHVAAISAASPVHPANDTEVASLARSCTVNQLRRALTGLPRPAPAAADDDPDPEPPPPPPPPRTFLRRGRRDDGTCTLNGVLDALAGALTDKALDAATEQLFRTRFGPHADPALRQRITTVDAFCHLMQTALDALDPATATHPDRAPSERYVVNIHLRPDDTAQIHLGPTLPDALRDELLCDTRVRTWVAGPDGTVNLGRTRRTVDPKLRLAVETCDGGCVIPGCDATRGLHIHHLVPWPAGGRTDTANLAHREYVPTAGDVCRRP